MADKPDYNEKNVGITGSSSSPSDEDVYGYTQHAPREKFWTRMGLTAESFQRRPGNDTTEMLNHTLKPRHLHMIAIGGSIGAGLFVGSGSALFRGVSSVTVPYMCRTLLT